MSARLARIIHNQPWRASVFARFFREREEMSAPLFIRAEWDAEAGVWVATSDDVPGLATESETIEGLIDRLRFMIPDLLAANGLPSEDVPFELLTRRFEIAQHAA
jgi:predicted RNase H-like HicB family nuclease